MIMGSFHHQSFRNREKEKFFRSNSQRIDQIIAVSDFHTKFPIHPLTIYVKDENNIPESVSW